VSRIAERSKSVRAQIASGNKTAALNASGNKIEALNAIARPNSERPPKSGNARENANAMDVASGSGSDAKTSERLALD